MRHATRVLPIAFLVAALPAAAADEEPVKRTEGRYFIEAAEIMLRANDFDTVIANVAPSSGAPSTQNVAELSEWNLDQPKITFGLNRPGKVSFQVTAHDFELSDDRSPGTFSEGGDQIVTTPLLAPGIVFQRQRPGELEAGGGAMDRNYTPNWGEEYGFTRRMDYRSFDLSVHRTFFQNTRFRARWIGGLRYAELTQKTSIDVAFAEEGLPSQPGQPATDQIVRDFYSVRAEASTHGIGPHFGLNFRLGAGKNQKWLFHAQGDVAMIPESTAMSYQVSMVDISGEYIQVAVLDEDGNVLRYVVIGSNVESPIIPGIEQGDGRGSTFNSSVRQSDFTEMTYLFEGTIGVSYQITRGISIGIEGWHLRWFDLLSDAGIFQSIAEEATYEVIGGDPRLGDPQLHDTESVIHVPRFHRRDDASFDGVSLNLRFEF